MRRYGIAVALAAACAGSVAAQQQPQPPTTTPQQPTAQTQPADQSAGMTTTIVGCVYKEQDVAGRTPNVAEKAGVLEDYILAQVESKSDSSAPASGASGAVGTSGSARKPMYKLEKIDDEKLRALVGKRVEVTGKVDPGASGAQPTSPQRDSSVGPDRIELPEFEVSSIKEVAGTCPATPSAR